MLRVPSEEDQFSPAEVGVRPAPAEPAGWAAQEPRLAHRSLPGSERQLVVRVELLDGVAPRPLPERWVLRLAVLC